MGSSWGYVRFSTIIFYTHFSSNCSKVRSPNGCRCIIAQNTWNHARVKPLGVKKIKLTFSPCFHPKSPIWPKKWTLKILDQNCLTMAMLISKLIKPGRTSSFQSLGWISKLKTTKFGSQMTTGENYMQNSTKCGDVSVKTAQLVIFKYN